MALAVGDSDRRQVTYDTEHVSCETYIYFFPFVCFFAFLVLVLLSAHCKRFSVALMRIFFFILLDPENYLSQWLSSKLSLSCFLVTEDRRILLMVAIKRAYIPLSSFV